MTRSEIGVTVAAALMLMGVLGCDGRLPPGGPGPGNTGPAGGVDGEGLPLLAALPQSSGSCTITNPPNSALETASWDAATRTFTMGELYWKLDEAGRTVEYGQTDLSWRHLKTRDEHGVLTAFAYEWNGGIYAPNSWDQTNSYDADGRLTASTLVYRSGTEQVFNSYLYEGGDVFSVTSQRESGGVTSDSWVMLYWNNGRLMERVRGSGSTVRGRDARHYNDDGRLTSIDIDGGGLAPQADGVVDMRLTWSYDDAGRLVHFEQDGTEATDAPVVDGVPDYVASFDASCAAIAVLPEELYLLDSWIRLP